MAMSAFPNFILDNYKSLLSLGKFGTILADPPWKFQNRTGKMAPEHKRLYRYETMSNEDIMSMPVKEVALDQSHLYLWVPNALVETGLEVMQAWGFEYKTLLIWYKIRKDGRPDRRGVGFYFRNVTEIILFGVRGKLRTGKQGRSQENIILSQKRGHSRKPDEIFPIIEGCSPGPFLELFARQKRAGWEVWGNETDKFDKDLEIYSDIFKKDPQPALFEKKDEFEDTI
jgi:N6-adenosine-specific RNA methylase IME4